MYLGLRSVLMTSETVISECQPNEWPSVAIVLVTPPAPRSKTHPYVRLGVMAGRVPCLICSPSTVHQMLPSPTYLGTPYYLLGNKAQFVPDWSTGTIYPTGPTQRPLAFSRALRHPPVSQCYAPPFPCQLRRESNADGDLPVLIANCQIGVCDEH